MTDVSHRSHRPRRSAMLPALALALALLLGGSLALAGPADAKVKNPRIVSLSPFATELLAQWNVKPVAVGDMIVDKTQRAWPPKKLRNVKVLKINGGTHGPNLEALLNRRPTLVLSTHRWARGLKDMRTLGIKQAINVDPSNPNQYLNMAKRIGRVVAKHTGRRGLIKRSKRWANNQKKQINKLQRQGRNNPLRVKTLAILGVGKQMQIFLKKSWGGRIIQIAGGPGTLETAGQSESGNDFVRVGDEALVATQPGAIFVVPHGTGQQIGDAATHLLTGPYAQLWAGTPAIEHDNLFPRADNRLLQASTNLPQVIRQVRKQLQQAKNRLP